MLLGILSSLLVASTPSVGAAAPPFTAQDTKGRTLALKQLLQKGPVVLVFFPKAFTGG